MSEVQILEILTNFSQKSVQSHATYIFKTNNEEIHISII